MVYYRNYASLEIIYYLLPVTTVAYFAGYGGVQSFEVLYIALIDFGIGTVLFTGKKNVIFESNFPSWIFLLFDRE